jgi:hypothetical protein
MPYPTHLILYYYIVMNWVARCAGNCTLQCHTFQWNSKFGVVIMPQEKQCRASVVGCKELPQRDGFRMIAFVCLWGMWLAYVYLYMRFVD